MLFFLFIKTWNKFFSNGTIHDCPPNQVLSQCVSSCPKTCQNPYVNSDNKECLRACASGCVCANGTLIDEGQNGACVPQDECTCFHHGKVYLANEILRRNGKKWFENSLSFCLNNFLWLLF